MIMNKKAAREHLLTVLPQFDEKTRLAIELLLENSNSDTMIEHIDDKHVKFNGHIYYEAKGYYFRHEPLHVAIYEAYNGQIVPPGYQVHHKDLNKSNNDPSNLQMMTRAEHSKLHNKVGKSRKVICKNCGKEFIATNKGNRLFCTSYCNFAWHRKYYRAQKKNNLV